jgi:hypothetical protein
MHDFSFLEDDDGDEKPIRVNTSTVRKRPSGVRKKKPKPQAMTTEQAGGCGCAAILLLLMIVGAVLPKQTQKEFQAGDHRRLAVICAQEHVKGLLKAPASAKWPGAFSGIDIETHAKKLADGTYLVDSYVDAQNSFGAMVRTRYVLKLNVFQDGNYSVIEGGLVE